MGSQVLGSKHVEISKETIDETAKSKHPCG